MLVPLAMLVPTQPVRPVQLMVFARLVWTRLPLNQVLQDSVYPVQLQTVLLAILLIFVVLVLVLIISIVGIVVLQHAITVNNLSVWFAMRAISVDSVWLVTFYNQILLANFLVMYQTVWYVLLLIFVVLATHLTHLFSLSMKEHALLVTLPIVLPVSVTICAVFVMLASPLLLLRDQTQVLVWFVE